MQRVGEHFRGTSPRLRETYDALMARVRQFGPVRTDAVKTSINLVSKYHFAAIRVRRDHLRIGFLSDAAIEDERIVRTERVGPRRVGYVVRLRTRTDVDDQLLAWLKRSYALQSR